VPAREGTLRVLEASLDAGVQRVVVTSSIAAITGGLQPSSSALTEDDWSDPDNPRLTAYARSKTIAERAAWDFVRQRGETEKLAVINPGAILGPVLSDDRSYSIEMIERLLRGMPGVPRIGFAIVDVRDVADLHLRAMTIPEAGGERFIAVGSFQWMEQVAEVLRDRLGEAAAKVPTRTVPNLLVRAMALFDPGIRSIVGQLGRRTEISSEKARTLLGWSPRPTQDTIVDCAQSLIDQGVVKQPA
jgi:nucleoside-diphosphate-sugar epimerase